MHSVMHVLKVSQIMASHHKMTNSGSNGLSSTFSGKFPIKMLIQAVKKRKRKSSLAHSPCFVSVFPS